MFSFFKKKQAPAEEKKAFAVKAYLSGKVVPIEEVKDEVFSSKALGDGLAIEPEENVIVAPCDATLIAASFSRFSSSAPVKPAVVCAI